MRRHPIATIRTTAIPFGSKGFYDVLTLYDEIIPGFDPYTFHYW